MGDVSESRGVTYLQSLAYTQDNAQSTLQRCFRFVGDKLGTLDLISKYSTIYELLTPHSTKVPPHSLLQDLDLSCYPHDEFTHIILLSQNDPPLTVPRQRPPNPAVR